MARGRVGKHVGPIAENRDHGLVRRGKFGAECRGEAPAETARRRDAEQAAGRLQRAVFLAERILVDNDRVAVDHFAKTVVQPGHVDCVAASGLLSVGAPGTPQAVRPLRKIVHGVRPPQYAAGAPPRLAPAPRAPRAHWRSGSDPKGSCASDSERKADLRRSGRSSRPPQAFPCWAARARRFRAR